MDLTKAEGIKKRWREYTKELYKKGLDPDNHDAVIIHLQPDILEFTFQDVWLQMSDHTIVIILIMKIFFVQFFCVFLPSLLNIFCFC